MEIEPEQERRPRRKTSQKKEDRPMWQEILFLIPKNLVYVFVIIIVFAFLAMLYITYTDRNMTELLTYDRTKEVVVVDPLFTSLQKSMQLSKNQPIVEVTPTTFNVKQFNSNYLRNNRPVIVRGMASEWNSVKKWSLEYLVQEAGDVSILYSQMTKKGAGNDSPWSFAKQIPMHLSGNLRNAISSIERNDQNSVSQTRPTLHFIDDEVLRGGNLRNDYEFPYLHQFMRLRSTSLSIWPQYLSHMRPRQNKGEQFMCVISGHIQLKMLSPVFSQNIYQGVYEDLNPVEVPEDISMFSNNPQKYPLLQEVWDYIRVAELKKGDCIYIPNFWFYQWVSPYETSIFLNFAYESSSKLSELFIEAIHAGVLEKSAQSISLPEMPDLNKMANNLPSGFGI